MKNNKQFYVLVAVWFLCIAALAGLLASCVASDQPQGKYSRSENTQSEAPQVHTLETEQAVQQEEPQEAAKPEPEEVEYFHVDRSTIVKCQESDPSDCGITLKHCSNGHNYYCLTNIKSEYRMELPQPEATQ